MQSYNSEKILVRYFSNVLDEIVVETLWTKIIDAEKGLYKIDNIPFYGPEFSSDDIVFAEFDIDEERITFRNVVEYSGNSTIQIIILDKDQNVQKLRNEFKELGCETEGTGNNYFVMEVLYEQNYSPIFKKLTELETAEKISFAEPNISQKHISEK
ncbi:DUF4265 domain-containing protein [Elizabethkingia sp. JS20170427COW]|uniref:DUF4265 domain-containing protein n=1 Tax=Elizabethkingia sp. JS20170427COW TaxID=2583851 RepID=UPI0011103ED3|nr:DUF4265 domain-containing protein [Elizabethkingia sp. JS20170427COW]QCX54384.1 DUF4265 domain-containing protein [Elizabethkingia sp. JS20170427COW]